MKYVDIYIDGACRGNGSNNAVGGWGVWSSDLLIEHCGGLMNTTNNRMELTAAIEGLKYILNNISINKANPIENNQIYSIYTDSNYVYKGITEWIIGWKRKDYKNVLNQDLWMILDKLNSHMAGTIKWNWIKGHSNNYGNDQADKLANIGCEQAIGGIK